MLKITKRQSLLLVVAVFKAFVVGRDEEAAMAWRET
jgi:hypothetical protein